MDEQDINTRVGARVCELRKAAGLTQTELGQKIGVTFQQVQKYENGANRISASKLWLISRCLGVHASAIIAELPGPDDVETDATQRLVLAWRMVPVAQREPLLSLIESLAVTKRQRIRARPASPDAEAPY